MIDFDVPDETRMLVDTVRRFVEAEVQPHEAAVEALGSVPDELRPVREKARALGLYGMSMPQDVGGGGLDTVTSCLVEEQMGKTSTTLIRYVFGQLYPLLLACKGEQRERYLLPLSAAIASARWPSPSQVPVQMQRASRRAPCATAIVTC